MPREDPTSFGGLPGDASRRPDGGPLPRRTQDIAREMREAGLREAAGLPPATPPRQTGKRVN